MDSFTARPTDWQIAKRAWRSTHDAIHAMPLLFLSAVTAAILLSLLSFTVPFVSKLVLARPGDGTSAFWPRFGIRLGITLLWAGLAAPVAVAMHRFILLDQVTRGPVSWLPRYTLAFLAWLCSLRLIYTLITDSLLTIHPLAAMGLIVGIVALAFAAVSVYLAMLFPAVATQVPSRSVSARLETSLELMNGHFWLFVWGLIIAFVPVLVATIIVDVSLLPQMMRQGVAGARPQMFTFGITGAVLLAIIQVVSVALAAAAASWLYGWVSRPSSDGA